MGLVVHVWDNTLLCGHMLWSLSLWFGQRSNSLGYLMPNGNSLTAGPVFAQRVFMRDLVNQQQCVSDKKAVEVSVMPNMAHAASLCVGVCFTLVNIGLPQ